jgi:hypothetical protein
VIYGVPEHAAQVIELRIDLPIDIFGSAFFMLSRYEEIVRSDRDRHDRFPAAASLAFQERFLERPIIDEYVEVLWAAIKQLWPRLHRKPHRRTLRVTCDVDSPYEVDFTRYAMMRGVAGDLLKRRRPMAALRNLHTRWRAWRGDFGGDRYWENTNWMMDVNEEAGNRVAFYFITDHTHPFDARYRMNELGIRRLLRAIHSRGHEIGLHASYNTYLNPEQTRREADILRRTLDDAGIPYAELGGRQHYLRWQTPQTARNWEVAGMSYDSTLCYADCAGFRCGTSREFIMYDVIARRPTKLKQRPLVLMDCSVVSDDYMAMGYTDEAMAYMQTLKERSLSLGGEFTLLWHNSDLPGPESRDIYQNLIKP